MTTAARQKQCRAPEASGAVLFFNRSWAFRNSFGYVRVVCRGPLEWSAPDRSTEDEKIDGIEGLYSPRAGIHSAAELLNHHPGHVS